MDLLKQDFKYVWHPFTQYSTEKDVIHIKRASGIWLYAADKKKYMDVNGSWWVNLYGHCHPEITSAISKQAETLEHVIFAGVTHTPAVTLAKRLVKLSALEPARAFFSDDGSTAIEVGLKMAIQYHHNNGRQCDTFIAFQDAYHGDTFGAMSVGARDSFNKPFENMMFKVEFIPRPNASNLQQVLQTIENIARKKKVAAFIYEPLIQGAAGMKMYEATDLVQILSHVKKLGILCIADEVFTGFGRTGTVFASQQMSIQPDMMVLSKGLTGGALPLGITLAGEHIFKAFLHPEKQKAFLHGHSFTANPMACAAALAALKILNRKDTRKKIAMITEAQSRLTQNILVQFPECKAESKGTVFRLEIPVQNNPGYYNSIRGEVYNHFLKKGILLRPLGNVIYLNPPYCITEKQLNLVHQEIIRYLYSVINNHKNL